jgi:hypothetical protein
MRRHRGCFRLASGAVRRLLLLVVAGLNGDALVACSSSSADSSGGPSDAASERSTSTDAGPDVIVDPNNCIPPGTPSNAAGVGGYCSPGGGQCQHAGVAEAGTICTADFGSVPAHAWFCTDVCDPDAASARCGAGGPPCITVEGESVCVPTTCMSFVAALEDGGSGD